MSIAARFDAQPTAGCTSHWAIRLPGWLRLEHERGQSRSVVAGRSGVDVLVSGGPGLAKPVSERAKTENRKQGGARGPPPGALGGHRAAARGSAGGKISGRILGARVGMRGRAPGWSLGLASHQIVQGLDRLSAQVRERRWWRASVTYPPHECGLARRAHQPSGSAPAATRARLDRRAAP